MGTILQFSKAGRVIGHRENGFGFIKDPGVHGKNGIYTGFHLHPAAGMAAASLPVMTNNEQHAPRPWNQGQTGSCTGHGTAGMVTTTFAARGKPLASPVLPRIVYCLGRAVDRTNPDTPLQDEGAQPNSVVRALGTWGCEIEGEDDGGRTAESADYASYLEAHVNDDPKLGELEKAGKRTLVGFSAIVDDDPNKLTQFDQALAGGYAVGIAVDAGNNAFQGYDETKGPLDYTGPDPDHWIFALDYGIVSALLAAGRIPTSWELDPSKKLYLIQNSWDVGPWTRTGRAWVTADFIARGAFNSLVARLGV